MDFDSATGRGRGIRIGDAERERAAETLGEHLRAGRLNVGEYDDRLAEAFAARTADDLTPLFADLPGGSPLTPPTPDPRWVAGRGGDRVRRGFGAVALPLQLLVVVLALIAAAVVCTLFVAFGPFLLIPLLWLGFGRRFGHRRYGHGPRRHHY